MRNPDCRVILQLTQIAAAKLAFRLGWVNQFTELLQGWWAGQRIIAGLGSGLCVKQSCEPGELAEPSEAGVLKSVCELFVGSHRVTGGLFDLSHLRGQQLLVDC